MFLERWSPRAFADDVIGQDALLRLLEAARWAPSAFNVQPWRFIYGRRGTLAFDRLLGLLIPFNQSWAKRAAALIMIASERGGDGAGATPDSRSFDAGAAWACLALQAHLSGWSTHAMTGIDAVKATTELKLAQNYRIEAMVAVGRIGDKALLPDKLRAREHPSGRLKLAEIVTEARPEASPPSWATIASQGSAQKGERYPPPGRQPKDVL